MGVGWGLFGFSTVQRANPGMGTPRFDDTGPITGGTSLPARTFTYQDDSLGKTFQGWESTPSQITTEPVNWARKVNVVPSESGNSLTKTAGVDGNWDAGAASAQAIASGEGYLEFIASEPWRPGGRVVGLSNGDTDVTPQDIDFGFFEDGSFMPFNLVDNLVIPVYLSSEFGRAPRTAARPSVFGPHERAADLRGRGICGRRHRACSRRGRCVVVHYGVDFPHAHGRNEAPTERQLSATFGPTRQVAGPIQADERIPSHHRIG